MDTSPVAILISGPLVVRPMSFKIRKEGEIKKGTDEAKLIKAVRIKTKNLFKIETQEEKDSGPHTFLRSKTYKGSF